MECIFEFLAHLFTTDHRLLGILEKHNDIVNLMTFSVETIVHSSAIAKFERANDFIVQSTAAQLCTFGITVDNKPNITANDTVTKARNEKKLNNLLETLNNHYKYVEHFKKNDRAVPEELTESIEKTRIEIENLKLLMKS